jgi:Flp pilus assembly protein TadG
LGFLFFFLVVYGLLTYGFIFMAQQSLNLAAQDAARAAVQWPEGTDPMTARASAAMAVAANRTAWVSAMGSSTTAVAVCAAPGTALSAQGGGKCSGDALDADQMEVVISYPYDASPLIPKLPGIGLITPQVLQARATTRLGTNYYSPPAAAGG